MKLDKDVAVVRHGIEYEDVLMDVSRKKLAQVGQELKVISQGKQVAILSSPTVRTRLTAEVLAGVFNVRFTLEPALGDDDNPDKIVEVIEKAVAEFVVLIPSLFSSKF